LDILLFWLISNSLLRILAIISVLPKKMAIIHILPTIIKPS
jgi:hypothetical protein